MVMAETAVVEPEPELVETEAKAEPVEALQVMELLVPVQLNMFKPPNQENQEVTEVADQQEALYILRAMLK